MDRVVEENGWRGGGTGGELGLCSGEGGDCGLGGEKKSGRGLSLNL